MAVAGSTLHREQPQTAQRELVMLGASEVMALWESLRRPLLLGLPPLAVAEPWSEERIMLALNAGNLVAWIYREGQRVLAVLTTTLTGDVITGSRALLLYSAHSEESLAMSDWRAMFGAVSEYGRSIGATRLLAYTNVRRMLDVVKELGGSAEQVLCSLPITASHV